MSKENQTNLSSKQSKELLLTLQSRFEKNSHRHQGLEWYAVENKLKASPEKLWSLYKMEETGGEPDVVGQDKNTGEYIFYDCAPETPKGRRSICYDQKALDSRKENKPKGNAVTMAADMGISLLTEAQYQQLQQLGNVDTKTSSWLEAPAAIRALGGAIFGDCRYGKLFIYHNGAESYYAGRGFRGALRV